MLTWFFGRRIVLLWHFPPVATNGTPSSKPPEKEHQEASGLLANNKTRGSRDIPYETRWEWNHTFYTRFTGTVTVNEAIAATNAFYDDPSSDMVSRVFWDFSAIDDFLINADEVEEIAASDHAASLYLPQQRAAFIIRHPGLIGLAEQYIAHMRELGSRWENRIFASVEEARQWLNAPREALNL